MLAITILTVGGVASAAPVEIETIRLDSITAGSAETATASGGAIAAYDSEVSVKTTGSVILEGSAQANAKGINLVNTTDSLVASPVNIVKADEWSTSGALIVDQENIVEQTQASRVASLPEFSREQASTHEISSSIGSETITETSNIVTQTVTDSSTTNTQSGEATSSVNTLTQVLGQDIRAGKGIAGSGDLQVSLSGGSIELAVGAAIDAGVGIGDVIDAGVNAEVSGKLTIELPDMEVDFMGTICAVQMGSCDATGGNLSEDSITDLTTTDMNETTGTTTTTNHDEQLDMTIRPPFFVANLSAENVAVDNSSVTTEVTHSVELSGEAQHAVAGINVVNASGSMVATPVNVAVLGVHSGATVNTPQMNRVTQVR